MGLPGDPLVAEATMVLDRSPALQRTVPQTAPCPDLQVLNTFNRVQILHHNVSALSLTIWDLNPSGFSRRAQETIMNCNKAFTRLSYQQKWLRFSRRLPPSSHPPREAGLSAIFDFLLHLVDKNLSHSPIKVYLATLSPYHEPVTDFRCSLIH